MNLVCKIRYLLSQKRCSDIYDMTKEARSIAEKIETQDKERKKVAAVASLEHKKLSLLSHTTPLIDVAIHNEDTIVMWTKKQLQDMLAEVFH